MPAVLRVAAGGVMAAPLGMIAAAVEMVSSGIARELVVTGQADERQHELTEKNRPAQKRTDLIELFHDATPRERGCHGRAADQRVRQSESGNHYPALPTPKSNTFRPCGNFAGHCRNCRVWRMPSRR